MCYNPMLAERLPVVNAESGKSGYRFLRSVKSWLRDHPESEEEIRQSGGLWIDSYKDDVGAVPTEPYANRYDGEYIGWRYKKKLVILPCGQCLDCRCRYAQEWANRIMLEAQYHDESYFITLTYDEEHVPVALDKSGEPVYTLQPKDLQDFIKRLRSDQEYHKDNRIRFYAVGEYGSTTHRPHYHIIVFGLKIDDLELIGKNRHGTLLHDSKKIREIWGLGLTEVDQMSWESAAYCARYTVKKLGKKETSFYEDHNLVPEFSRMSLKPAIGYQYFDEYKEDIYKNDEIFISTVKGGRKCKPPKYYDDKYDDIYPADMAVVKGNRREIAENSQIARLSKFGGSYLELLYLNEEKMKHRNAKLRRNLE